MNLSESTEAMRRKILSDAEDAAQRIIEEGKEKATEILKNTTERSREKKEAELERRQKYLDEKTREGVAEKKVEHHRRLQTFKSELIESVFNTVKVQLQKYVQKPEYKDTLFNLIVEAGVALEGGKLVVGLNKRDKQWFSTDALTPLAQAIEKKTGIESQLILKETDEIWGGGVILSKFDKKATVNNTLEARLEKIMDESKAELETILFK